MIIVSGCPRSGTSLMMNVLRTALGPERVMGRKGFGEEDCAGGTPMEREAVKYAEHAVRRFQGAPPERDTAEELNPDGFWECRYTVEGIRFNMADHVRQEKLLAAGSGIVCKIVSQGLFQTDPRFVDKIIFMLRHPRMVAKSQEKLKHQLPFEVPEGMRVHTPEMFINVSGMAATWLRTHNKPVLTVLYDDLLDNTSAVMQRITAFLGEDVSAGAAVIKGGLRRSTPDNVESDMWGEAEEVYARLVAEDYSGIVEYLKDPRLAVNLRKRRWLCARRAVVVDCVDCARCRGSRDIAMRLRRTAEALGVMWRVEPCLYECGFSPFGGHISIADSIARNTWSDLCLPQTN